MRDKMEQAIRWLTEHVFRLPTMADLRHILHESYQTTIDRLEANRDKEDARTEELRAILVAKTALVESRETNAELRENIRAVGGKPAKAEPEVAPSPPVARGRRA